MNDIPFFFFFFTNTTRFLDKFLHIYVHILKIKNYIIFDTPVQHAIQVAILETKGLSSYTYSVCRSVVKCTRAIQTL